MAATSDTLTLSRAPQEADTTGAGNAADSPAPEYERFRLAPAGLLERRRTAQTCYVFDLRDADAFAQEHLPGAYNLPFEHLEANLHRLPFSGDLLFYDGGEGSTRQAAALLYDNGFADFWYIEDGYAALKAALLADPNEVNYQALGSPERAAKVEQVLDEKVREFLARDGGGMEVIAIEDSKVLVSYHGACGSCSSSTAGTLRFIQNVLTVALNHEIEVVPVDG
jgi:Fe-S cluster biogenesis protein NfuA/rhodanese-related sulfurtransferase